VICLRTALGRKKVRILQPAILTEVYYNLPVSPGEYWGGI